MNKIAGFTMLLTMTGCALAAPLARAAPPSSIPAAFMQQLVAGINARDLPALRRLIHPETLRCMTPDSQDYYAWSLWGDGSKRYTIASGYKIRLEKPIDAQRAELEILRAQTMLRDLPLIAQHWPVQPDFGFYIIYSPAPGMTIERMYEATITDGEAQLVMACPTKAFLDKFHEKQASDAVRRHKLEALWKSLPTKERSELAGMAHNGKKLDLMKLAQEKYGLNADESLAFMDMAQYADTP
jgi:hypothetical protein